MPHMACGQFGPHELANTAWSFSMLPFRDCPALAAGASQRAPHAEEFQAKALAATAWSFAELEFGDPPLCAAIGGAAIDRLGEFAAQGLANTAWAFSEVRAPEQAAAEAAAAWRAERAAEFQPLELRMLAWAAAQLPGGVISWGLPLARAAASHPEAARAALVPLLAECEAQGLHNEEIDLLQELASLAALTSGVDAGAVRIAAALRCAEVGRACDALALLRPALGKSSLDSLARQVWEACGGGTVSSVRAD